jgi:LacI family transcriptional regulator
MCDTRDDPARERQYVDMLLGRQVDGLIVTGRRIEPRPSVGAALGKPVVYAMTQSLDSDEPAVLRDDYGGGRMAAAHLLEGGRSRLRQSMSSGCTFFDPVTGAAIAPAGTPSASG